LEIPGRKIWPLKKIKVKMGLKKQEAWVDGIVFVSGRIAFLNKLKIFHHHHYFSKE